jgi:hypothetical protein
MSSMIVLFLIPRMIPKITDLCVLPKAAGFNYSVAKYADVVVVTTPPMRVWTESHILNALRLVAADVRNNGLSIRWF